MNVLVLNGSPRGKNSNTMKLTNSFLNGMKKAESKIETTVVNLTELKIDHCLGCFACWGKTPGKCVIKDDVESLLKQYLEADVIIWSFPLYYFGMPSKIKAFMDRMLPLNLPHIEKTEDGSGQHPSRYDMSNKKYILISTCGFHSVNNNYEALIEQFNIVFEDKLEKILTPEGELFSVPELKKRTDEYLSHVFKAGEEYILEEKISKDTRIKLEEKLYPTEIFLEMANTSWQMQEAEGSTSLLQSKTKALLPMKLMTTIYNSKSLKREGIIFEFYFTDIEEKYQLKLFKDRCELSTDEFEKYDTKIETSFELWQQISRGEVDAAQAIMDNKYKVYGDFSLMMDFANHFRAGSQSSDENKKVNKEENKSSEKKTNMGLLFIPWIPYWSVNGILSAIGGILMVTGINLFSDKYKLTIYDKINMTAVSLLSLAILAGVNLSNISPLSYTILAVIWGASCATKIPLTAYYSVNDYGAELFNNPIFIKTNRILTFAWSLVYLIIGLSEYLAVDNEVNFVYILIGKIISFASMLAFTKWFADWYPAKVARG